MSRAITFDLRDVGIHDDSDEPERAAGLPSKREARRALVREALAAATPAGKLCEGAGRPPPPERPQPRRQAENGAMSGGQARRDPGWVPPLRAALNRVGP